MRKGTILALIAAAVVAASGLFIYGEWALDVALHTIDGTRAVSQSWQAQSPPQSNITEYSNPRWPPVATSRSDAAISLLKQQSILVVSKFLASQLTNEPTRLDAGEIPVLVRAVRWKENLEVRLRPTGIEVLTWGYDCFGWNPEPAPYPVVVNVTNPPASLDIFPTVERF
ncbi:MAG TPA: hypothetical protein VMV18_16005 [bacterium]|nr:hypothetical protein [bacterium]